MPHAIPARSWRSIPATLRRSSARSRSETHARRHPAHASSRGPRRWRRQLATEPARPAVRPGSERLPGEPTRLRQGDRRGARSARPGIHGARHPGSHGRPHCLCRTWGGVQRRYAVQRGLRPPVRGHAEQMVGSLAKLAQLPAENAGVLRPRVHGEQPEIRAGGRAAERRGRALPGRMQHETRAG